MPFFPAAALTHRDEESLEVPTKRRRVTAEMEGKYIINMPKGTTPRTRKILEQQQAAKGTGPWAGQTAFPLCCFVDHACRRWLGNRIQWRTGEPWAQGQQQWL